MITGSAARATTSSSAAAAASSATLFHVDLRGLVIANGYFQVITAVLAAAPTRVIVRASAQGIGS